MSTLEKTGPAWTHSNISWKPRNLENLRYISTHSQENIFGLSIFQLQTNYEMIPIIFQLRASNFHFHIQRSKHDQSRVKCTHILTEFVTWPRRGWCPVKGACNGVHIIKLTTQFDMSKWNAIPTPKFAWRSTDTSTGVRSKDKRIVFPKELCENWIWFQRIFLKTKILLGMATSCNCSLSLNWGSDQN